MEEARFRWTGKGFKNKFEDVAKITRAEQLFENNSPFINRAEPSMMQFEAFETFPHLLKLDAMTSC
jgi:hypothetical protein